MEEPTKAPEGKPAEEPTKPEGETTDATKQEPTTEQPVK
jgi:hypothetical protein